MSKTYRLYKVRPRRIKLKLSRIQRNSDILLLTQDGEPPKPKDVRVFQDYGYMGLYDGLRTRDIHARKGLEKKQRILDHMGFEEIASNVFKSAQTAAKVRREKITGKDEANQTHYDVGKVVRDAIKRLGGTMPEEL